MRATHWAAMALLAAQSLSMLTACPHTCSLVAVYPGLLLNVPNEAPGRHRLEADVPGGTLSVEYDVGADRIATCIRCEDTTNQLSLSRLMYAESSFNLYNLDRGGGPEVIQLRIYRDNVLIVDQELRPSYRTYEPNGEGCGETTSATLEIDLP